MTRTGPTFLLAVAVVAGASARAQDSPPRPPKAPRAGDRALARPERAIEKALAWLAAKQNEDGSWTERIGRRSKTSYLAVRSGKHAGVTALAGLALLQDGGIPGKEHRHAAVVARAVKHLTDRAAGVDGFITHGEPFESGTMYSHCLATIFLARVHRKAPSGDVARVLGRAVHVLEVSQDAELGGWRYLPGAPGADISVTVFGLEVLLAARDAGIPVKDMTIARAVDYVRRSWIGDAPDLLKTRRGGFRYQLDRPRTSFALTAVGTAALFWVAEGESEAARGGLDYLLRPASWPSPGAMERGYDYLYGHHYAARAIKQVGGETWRAWYPRVRDQIVRGQHDDGTWEDLVGPVYATAMATLTLQLGEE